VVHGYFADEAREFERGVAAVVARRERFGVGFEDLPRGPEPWAFFAAAARRWVVWKRSAAFLVVKLLRRRVPLASRQSAKYRPFFFNTGHLPDTGLAATAPVAALRWESRLGLFWPLQLLYKMIRFSRRLGDAVAVAHR
jgi:hypothetical protein